MSKKGRKGKHGDEAVSAPTGDGDATSSAAAGKEPT